MLLKASPNWAEIPKKQQKNNYPAAAKQDSCARISHKSYA